ncbi:unnamed protein product [Arabis nemorensis]|uniref:Uncharacterized protein n=1 Tax=Arabis nemorensis TaxID=586526 RepID=A0A565CM62_9BRAS|nr:unnamed protein product [Arabis nemorensis]
MEPDEIRFHIFSMPVDKYSRILMPSEKLEQFDACPATVLEAFFLYLRFEKPEERMVDLHASVAGVDYLLTWMLLAILLSCHHMNTLQL